MVIGKIVRFANKREMVGFVGLKLVEGTFIGGYAQDTCLLTEGDMVGCVGMWLLEV